MIETPETVDVAVVGYGPVGMATAALLGAAGHHVVVLERYAGLYNLPRAAIFDDETMRTLRRVSASPRSCCRSCTCSGTTSGATARASCSSSTTSPRPGRSGWAEWYMMYQPELEDALDRSRPRCRTSRSVSTARSTGLADHGDRVELQVGGREPHRVRAR